MISLKNVIDKVKPDYVFHLAAQTIVSIANRSPLSTFESNIRGTYNLLEACRNINTIQSIIIASSDKAYGEQTQLPYDESFALEGNHPYDVSKSCADLIARSYFVSYRLPLCITRCGNFYGGGDLNFNRLIPGTIRSVIAGEPPVIRSNGQFIRDYLYIEEAVSAYLHLAEKMQELPIHGEAFNIGPNLSREYSVLDLIITMGVYLKIISWKLMP